MGLLNDTTLLLDLDGRRRVQLATADETARACPTWGVFASSALARLRYGSACQRRSVAMSADRRLIGWTVLPVAVGSRVITCWIRLGATGDGKSSACERKVGGAKRPPTVPAACP
jgi:hypothetical protein